MKKLLEINVLDREQWNEIVTSFSDYEVFYLNEYVTAFMNENESNGIPILFYYEHEDDRAINVAFKRDVAKDNRFKQIIQEGEYYDLITPYGYGGFWGEVTNPDALMSEYNNYCKSNNYICEFVRFDLFGEYCKYYDGRVVTRSHNVIRNLELPLDELWMEVKHKVRKNVNKANSNNLEIIVDYSGLYLNDFLEIYYSTMERNSAESEYYFSREFFEMLDNMNNNIAYFHVKYEEKIIATELVIYGANNCYSFLGGTNPEYFNLRPNDFLKYEIIKWAKQRELKNFVLGGGYGSDDGIFQYKVCLAPNGIVDYYMGMKIFDEEKYNKLVDIRSREITFDTENNFFPLYRGQ